MINSATCKATDLAGARQPSRPQSTSGLRRMTRRRTRPPTRCTSARSSPTATVFDANTCNATVQSGCGTLGTLPASPGGPNRPMSMPRTTPCTRPTTTTRSRRSTRVTATRAIWRLRDRYARHGGAVPAAERRARPVCRGGVALHSVYVTFQRDDALMVVDTNLCNASHPAGCETFDPPAARTGAQPKGSSSTSGRRRSTPPTRPITTSR